MQIPPLLLAVAAEIYLALLFALMMLLWHSRKQKTLIGRQQKKLLELINAIKAGPAIANNLAPVAPISAPTTSSYRQYISAEIALTESFFSTLAPAVDIGIAQPLEASAEQRIAALRHAFLRAEEQAAIESPGSERYWNVLTQMLSALLPPEHKAEDDIELYKRRIENLEKFKKLFFELEAQWQHAQTNAQDYYARLKELTAQLDEKEHFDSLLNNYHETYQGMDQHFAQTNSSLTELSPQTIKIIRQDPRAAEEIIKLRNVAADQYRIIHNLQRKLEDAQSEQEKSLIVHELEQQLHRQMRFVQESDTCIQLLEEELAHANEKIAQQEQQLDAEHHVSEENELIKETLQHFTLESKDLLHNIDDLEEENRNLRTNLDQLEHKADSKQDGADQKVLEQIQTDYASLQRQYAELEEKYLALRMK